MKTHYTEADLLETYYMQPGASMPVMMHLAACDECGARYDRLDRKLREVAAHPEPPETFWIRQRLGILKRIASQPRAFARLSGLARIAAAAALAFVLGGAAVYHQVRATKAPVTTAARTSLARVPTVEEMHGPINPWASDELKQYHDVVQWESWVADAQRGDEPL